MNNSLLPEAQSDGDDPLADENAFYRHDWHTTPLGPPDSWPEPLRLWVRFMLPSAQPTLLVWGPERILLFNRAYAGLLGDGWREVLGASAPVIWSKIWSEIEWIVEDVFSGNSGFMDKQPIRSFATDFTELHYYSRSYSPITDADGRVLGGVLFTHERTAEVEEQQRLGSELDVLKRLLENVTSFVAVTHGPGHLITYTNAAFRRFVGHRNVIGLTVEQAFPELVGQRLAETLTRVFETGEPFSATELPFKWQPNEDVAPEWRYVTTVYQPLFDGTGTITGVFAEGHDVTAHVLAKSALIDLHNEHVHIARVNAMGTMAATLAHELNQPLTAASNYLVATQRILGRDIDPLAAEGLGQAAESVLRAGAIIRSLRNMTSRGEVKREAFDLGLAAQEALKLVSAAGFKDAHITIEQEHDLSVVGDRIQIEQVLVNLIKNAVEAVSESPTKEVRVCLRQSGREAQVCVEDSGPGVCPDVASSLFESFASAKGAGMGVGLSICRTIIEAHGGRIWLDEASAGGASICFNLHLANGEDGAATGE